VEVLYVSPVPFQSVAQRPQHYVRWLHEHFNARILWIETPPLRYPRLSDLTTFKYRSFNKISHQAIDDQSSWLKVLRLPGLPLEPSGLGRLINRRLWRESARLIDNWLLNAAETDGDRPPTRWLAVGRPCDAALWLHTRFSSLRLHYDVMDDVAEFYDGAARQWVIRCDEELCTKAELVSVSSLSLQNKYLSRSSNCHYVANGLAWGQDLVRSRSAVRVRAASAQANLERPLIAGYVGSIASWFDWTLLLKFHQWMKVHSGRPFEIHLTGPLHEVPPKDLPKEIYIHRPVEHKAIWDELAKFDVALIPFKKNRLTEAVDPVKYYEYRALGLPVLSSAFGDMALRDKDDGVYFFEELLDGRLRLDAVLGSKLDQDSEFLEQQCWENKFSVIQDLIADPG